MSNPSDSLSSGSGAAEHDHSAHDHDHQEHEHQEQEQVHDHDAENGHSDHDHDHEHDHDHDFRDADRRSLVIALVLISGFMVAEVIGGILSGSLALLADAGHMITDAAAIALALFALWLSARPASVERTFGYHRAEVLAALFNALSLWLIAAYIFFEAYRRLSAGAVELEGPLMLTVGAIGLVVNIVVALVLHRSSQHSLNVEGAFLHVLGDLLGSVAVVIAGLLVFFFADAYPRVTLVDPIMSIVIGLLIVFSSWRLIVKVLHVLLEDTPTRLDVYRLCSDIEDVEGVTLIHDVHAWTISSGYESLTAHVLADPDYRGDLAQMLSQVRQIAYDHGLHHITIQLETSLEGCTEDHHVEHLQARSR